MGFGFRKSFKIAPGVRLNVGKKGISSVSVGGKCARVSVGKKAPEQQLALLVQGYLIQHLSRIPKLHAMFPAILSQVWLLALLWGF
jgi:hypothetical protein